MSITTKSSSRQSIKGGFSRTGTFADLLVGHVRERGGRASSVYGAARIDRRTYSSIISHPFRAVSKRTAIQFALALRLTRKEADRLLIAVNDDMVKAFHRSRYGLGGAEAVAEKGALKA